MLILFFFILLKTKCDNVNYNKQHI